MPLSILLSEDDLRSMDTQLRDMLLKWYFDRGAGGPVREPNQPPSTPSVVTTPTPIQQKEFPALDGSRRVTFPELARFGLIKPGGEIWCRSLKRQHRRGVEPFINGAKITSDGRVDFAGDKFSSPSKLARAMVNANGGQAQALNGYDYLFVLSGNGLVSLEELRQRFLDPLKDPRVKAMAEILVQDGHFQNLQDAALWELEMQRSLSNAPSREAKAGATDSSKAIASGQDTST